MCLRSLSRLGLCIAPLTFVAGAQRFAFNSTWWTYARDGEKTGFVLGSGDCPVADKMIAGLSSDDYIHFVDSRLTKTGSKSPDAVPQILHSAPRFLKPKPMLQGGEEYPEKHGWLDGAWWGDATSGDADEKLGYVEGYLQCEFGSASVRVTNSYVHLLNAHYANPAKEHDKIANVLQPAIDRRRKPK